MRLIKILIVEDERTTAVMLAHNLTQVGYQVVDIVESGNQAIHKIATMQVDIVLMDIILKGDMNGITTSAKIKADYNLPILYLISLSDRETLKQERKTNPSDYILKSYDLNDLKATIDSALPRDQNQLAINLRKIKRKAKLATHKIQKNN